MGDRFTGGSVAIRSANNKLLFPGFCVPETICKVNIHFFLLIALYNKTKEKS